MKIYSQIIDLSKTAQQTFWVAPNSQFKLGVKLVQENEFKVMDGQTELESDGDVDGFATYPLQSTSRGEKTYIVEADNGQKVAIKQVTTDSTVFEVGGGGSTPEGNLVKSVNGEFPVDNNVDVQKLKIKDDGWLTGDTIMQSLDNIDDQLTLKADLTAIVPVSPSTSADEDKLAGAKSTAEFVNSSINALAAFYITKDPDGAQFDNAAELMDGQWYNAGVFRQPTQNDYAIVQVDENHDGATTRYIWQGGEEDGRFEYQYTINRAPLTQAQLDALNSGITAADVNDMAKKSELDANTITLAGEYEDQTPFSFVVYIKN